MSPKSERHSTKKPANNAALSSNDSSEIVYDNLNILTESVRRGRGRPKKLKELETAIENEEKAEADSKMEPKSTGKKTKENARSERKIVDYFRFVGAIHEKHGMQIFGCSFSPYIRHQDNCLATVGSDMINVYELPPDDSDIAFRLLRTFRDPSPEESFYTVVWMYCVKSQRHLIAAAGYRGIIRVIAPDNGECFRSLIGHGEPVNELRVHPLDSAILASAGRDSTIRLWNVSNDNNLSCLLIFGGVDGHTDQILSIDFHHTGQYILSGSMDHSVKLWDLRDDTPTGKAIIDSHSDSFANQCLEVHFPLASANDLHTNYVDSVRFYGDLIFSKSSENSLKLWKFGDFDDSSNESPSGKGDDLTTETAVSLFAEMILPNAEMWFLKFDIDPTRRLIACGNEIGEIHTWPLDRGLPPMESTLVIHLKELKCPIRQIVFSFDGKHLVSVADDATIWRFNRESGRNALNAPKITVL